MKVESTFNCFTLIAPAELSNDLFLNNALVCFHEIFPPKFIKPKIRRDKNRWITPGIIVSGKNK